MPDVHTDRPLYRELLAISPSAFTTTLIFGCCSRDALPSISVLRGCLTVASLVVSPLPSLEELSLIKWPMSVN